MMPTRLISSAHLKKTVPRHRKRFAAMTRINSHPYLLRRDITAAPLAEATVASASYKQQWKLQSY
jgi:hypothetical protein